MLGSGTGLGMAGLVFVGDRPVALASEGGHVSMAAYDERETYLIEAARHRYGHPSAERLLSGPGLTFIHEMLHGGPARSAEDIGSALLNGDPASRESCDLFFRMLGTVAANMALCFGAFGGVYIGGGIAPHYVAQMKTAGFRERFEDKGRYRDYLRAIPTWVITADQPTLLGLAAFAATSSGTVRPVLRNQDRTRRPALRFAAPAHREETEQPRDLDLQPQPVIAVDEDEARAVVGTVLQAVLPGNDRIAPAVHDRHGQRGVLFRQGFPCNRTRTAPAQSEKARPTRRRSRRQ